MEIDFERARKPVRKLRKLLKSLPRDPRPEEVHELRTLTRKLEAMLHAVDGESTRQSRRVLKQLKPVRAAAGRVRDMDVLIVKAAGLSFEGSSGGVARLIEHLSAIRIDDTTRLYRAVKRCRKKGRRLLKRCLRRLERMRAEKPARMPVTSAPAEVLTVRLEHWPPLEQENLHDFRKGVKELRYMLQMLPNQDQHHMNALARVKDTVGDWHDWLRLEQLAKSILDPKRDAVIMSRISDLLREKLRTALAAANQLRKLSFDSSLAA